MRKKTIFFSLFFICMLVVVSYQPVFAEGMGVNVSFGNENDLTSSMKTFLLVGVLALAPAFLLMLTPFPYIVIILGLTKQGLGTQAVPPAQVMVGLALFLTIFIMKPVGMEVYEKAYVPYEKGKITMNEFVERAEKPIKKFMIKNTEEKSLLTFIKINKEEKPKSEDEVSIWTAIPAYATSMLNLGLHKGLLIYIAFILIDLIFASILMFMSMMMMPPQMVSVPFKLLIFLAVGGFNVIIELIYSGIQR